SQFCLLIVIASLLCSCANMKSHSGGDSGANVRDLFNRALVDCRKSNSYPTASISLSASHYWLPESVETLIAQGTNALPVLSAYTRSSDFAEKELASVCIELIETPRLEKGPRRVDENSGITLVSFVAAR